MQRHGLAAALAVSMLAVGCATGPIGSDAPPTASPAVTPLAAASAATACTVPRRLAGLDVERLPVTERVVALTFDAGANADGLRPILRVLSERRVPATFFLTGDFVQRYPVRSARTARLQLVGNHTLTHPDLTLLGDLAVVRQVRVAERVIRDMTGEDPRRFFRFPLGARDAHRISLLNELCYVPFRWTVDTLGWKGTREGITAGIVVRRVLDAARPGAIVLMHVGSNPYDGSMLDADALPRIIRQLRSAGYELVRLSRVMSPAP